MFEQVPGKARCIVKVLYMILQPRTSWFFSLSNPGAVHISQL